MRPHLSPHRSEAFRSYATACAATFLLAAAARGEMPDFGAPSIIVADRPIDLIEADLDSDGFRDLVTLHRSGEVNVLMGRGDGTFRQPLVFPTGHYPFEIAIGDLDGDALPDIATANVTDDEVSLLFGNGDGTFQARIAIDVGDTLHLAGVAIADLDGDTIPDLVATSTSHSATAPIRVLLGNGDGTFEAPIDAPASGCGNTLAVDLDGDNSLDLVTAYSTLIGNGDGSFQSPANYLPVCRGNPTVAVAFFDADAVPDIVTASQSGGTNGDTMVLLGNGDGTFHSGSSFPATGRPRVEAADWNDDGNADVLTVRENTDEVVVRQGNGDGSFQPPVSFRSSGRPYAVAVVDLDGDSVTDMAVANRDVDEVRVLSGDGAGGVLAIPTYAVGDEPRALVVGDFDGDVIPDIATSNEASADVTILFGNGDGSFQPAVAFPAGPAPTSLATGDIDGDSALDIVTADGSRSTELTVLLGVGDGGFEAPQLLAIAGGNVKLADLDGNEHPDILVLRYDPFPYGFFDTARICPHLGNGDASFTPHACTTVGQASVSDMLVDDFVGGRTADVAVNYTTVPQTGGYSTRVFTGTGSGGFTGVSLPGTEGSPRTATAADFDDDTITDLAFLAEGDVLVLPGDGAGNFGPAVPSAAGGSGGRFESGDLDGDGIPDLAVLVAGGDAVQVMLGNGDGSLRAPHGFVTGPAPRAVALADLNLDDALDIVALTDDSVTVLMNLPEPSGRALIAAALTTLLGLRTARGGRTSRRARRPR